MTRATPGRLGGPTAGQAAPGSSASACSIRSGDGRRPGIPNGPRFVEFSKIWQVADGAWSTKGGTGWVGGFCGCSPQLDGSGAGPGDLEPADESRIVVAEYETKLAKREQALVDARSVIGELARDKLFASFSDRLRELADAIDEALEPNIEHAHEGAAKGITIDEA